MQLRKRSPGGDYRVPLTGLLASLLGTYRLDEEIRALDERYAAVSDADVQVVLAGDRLGSRRSARPVVLDTSVARG